MVPLSNRVIGSEMQRSETTQLMVFEYKTVYAAFMLTFFMKKKNNWTSLISYGEKVNSSACQTQGRGNDMLASSSLQLRRGHSISVEG